ncbi:DUF7681 family protein [Endozoicomonas sp. ALC066]|uniref:Acb2/Tad1 domain-containing protein n=1 Tax=Endozoicomonas sp. ALC066 TaxID=3403078 RepID=UPI003BB72F06
MKDQHKKIKGYRDLTQEEIDLMNEAKELGEQCRLLTEKVRKSIGDVSADTSNEEKEALRWLAIGRTDLQKGFMAVVRSIAKPTTF